MTQLWDREAFAVRFGLFFGLPAGAGLYDSAGLAGVGVGMAIIAVVAVGAMALDVRRDVRAASREDLAGPGNPRATQLPAPAKDASDTPTARRLGSETDGASSSTSREERQDG